MTRLQLGPIGMGLNVTLTETYVDDAAELEGLGYDTIWIPGGQLASLDPIGAVIRGTEHVPVGSAIIPTSVHDAAAVTAMYADIEATHPGRFVVGLGAAQQQFQLTALNSYLDRLDAGSPPIPKSRRMLAAIGPRKLALARERTAGSLPLLVTPDYTAAAREILGTDSTLVIHQFVVLSTDPTVARTLARGPLSFLATVGGYVASFRKMGFTDDDISGLSDRLVDGVTTWGDLDTIKADVKAHLDAGADQVALGILDPRDRANPRETWRELAAALVH